MRNINFFTENLTESTIFCLLIRSFGSTPRKAGSKMLVFENGKTQGSVGGGAVEKQIIQDAREMFEKSLPTQVKEYELETDLAMLCGGKVEIYFEMWKPKTQLYIFGAGHIGKILAKMAVLLDFAVTLIDPRKEMFDSLQNETEINIFCNEYQNVLNNISFGKNIFIVIVTHSHEIDKEIAAFCAKKTFSYLGMIGSKRKWNEIQNYYRENKMLTETEILQINCPIGIPISCETPEEIAVSILAKLIDERNKTK